jgi:hypothetical protein
MARLPFSQVGKKGWGMRACKSDILSLIKLESESFPFINFCYKLPFLMWMQFTQSLIQKTFSKKVY